MNDDHEGHVLAQLCADKAGDEWQNVAYRVFLSIAQEYPTFTTGFVRRMFEQERPDLTPHDNRAWGAITRRAVKAGVIQHSMMWETTGSHRRPDAIWRSLIVQKKSA